MIIDCIGCMHGYYPKLKGGDLLLITGDLTAKDTNCQNGEFQSWTLRQDYKKIIYIAGNHDNFYQEPRAYFCINEKLIYLQDSGMEFEGLKIWGSPWSLAFEGINPKCKAFTVETDKELAEKWALIPDDIDILITHIPPHGIFDQIKERSKWGKPYSISVGSMSLRNIVMSNKFSKIKLHVFSHIHEMGGRKMEMPFMKFVNASHVNEIYEPVNLPIRIEL